MTQSHKAIYHYYTRNGDITKPTSRSPLSQQTQHTAQSLLINFVLNSLNILLQSFRRWSINSSQTPRPSQRRSAPCSNFKSLCLRFSFSDFWFWQFTVTLDAFKMYIKKTIKISFILFHVSLMPFSDVCHIYIFTISWQGKIRRLISQYLYLLYSRDPGM